MIPGIHYPEDERYDSSEKQTKCPYCGYTHISDISFYKKCVSCGKPMVSVTSRKE